MSRNCPLCRLMEIPTYRAICGKCFPKVPWKVRADLLHAWRKRAAAPYEYAEKLAEAREWYRDFSATEKTRSEMVDDGDEL